MRIPEKISALQAKRKLLRQLDASLLAHAAALCGSPSVEQVYRPGQQHLLSGNYHMQYVGT